MVQVITASSEIPRQGLVLVDFFATWCGPCKTVAPYFEQLAATFTNVKFLKADVDDFEDEHGGFDVNVLPTFMFLRDGLMIQKIEGADLNRVMKLLSDLSS
jgi:thioredoxin 1